MRSTGTRHRASFLQSLCSGWQAKTGERLATVELVMMQETEQRTRPSLTTMRTLASVKCR